MPANSLTKLSHSLQVNELLEKGYLRFDDQEITIRAAERRASYTEADLLAYAG